MIVTVCVRRTWKGGRDGRVGPALGLPRPAPPLRFLDAATLRAGANFPADRRRLDVPASTLLQPRVLEYARAEWRGY